MKTVRFVAIADIISALQRRHTPSAHVKSMVITSDTWSAIWDGVSIGAGIKKSGG